MSAPHPRGVRCAARLPRGQALAPESAPLPPLPGAERRPPRNA